MIFQNSMGLRKSRCDDPSGTTQGWACPLNIIVIEIFVFLLFGYRNVSR